MAKVISVSDIRASDKQKYTPYQDKRTVGSGLNQPQWMRGFLEYKLDQNFAEGIVKNLVNYVKNPSENINILSISHRNKISQQLLRKNHEKDNFVADLKEYFRKKKIYSNTNKPENETAFMAKVLYSSLKEKWNKNKSKDENMINEELQEKIKLLKHKKQIILQGSPGTGKTREAKEIAEEMAPNNYKLIQFHPAYSYEDFVRGIVATTTDDGKVSYKVQNKVLAEMAENANTEYELAKDEDKPANFVLIIDEINRANLSSVLGELIYALEYRGEVVESMYELDGSREIVLPENLYIIGTMNTADRSVGHIDYAIRRRFAFVDVNTDESVIPKNAKSLFGEIKHLFNEYLSEEFELNDVMIGHSYFLADDLKQALKYEIKPILYEYLKDGVLTCEKDKINDLKTIQIKG